MKFSYSWIREMVDGLDLPAESLERLVTMRTAECEGIETAGELLAGAVPARVEAVEQIEGGKHVVKAIVDAGKYGRKTVVCGAPNCRAGITTVYVPLGSKSIAGVLSEGMLASASELGISRDHAGIIELGPSAELPAPDHVIDIDNKSITHRPDLWGHHGMAREVAAITGRTLRDPVNLSLLPELGSPIKVEIEDLALCPRYSALAFENVTVQPSPLWLQNRLTSVGLNPINNIVDLTNYIMAELAQPMHAFDREKLHGDTIFARPASHTETLVALDEKLYVLDSSNIVIADANGPIALAGVIGGHKSAISDATTSIVLESANFNAASVRKTSVALKLRTDASMRFEKSQDPHNTVRALARALELLPIISPGIRLVGGLADHHAAFTSASTGIDLDLDWLARKLGRVLDIGEVRRILEGLHFGVELSGSGRSPGRDYPLLAGHQRRSPARRSGRRSRPHDRLRFHPAATPASPLRAILRPARTRIPPRNPPPDDRPRLHRGLELLLHQRRIRPPLRPPARRPRPRPEPHRRRSGTDAHLATPRHPRQHR